MKPGSASRLTELGVAAVLLVATVVWVERTVRHQLERLRPELDDPALSLVGLVNEIKAEVLERPSAGAERGEQSASDRADRLAAQAAQLQSWPKRMTAPTFPAAQEALMIQLSTALTHYAESKKPESLLGTSPAPSARVLALCDELKAMAGLESRRQRPAQPATLVSLQRVWFLSLLLVAVVGGLVTAVFYRRLIAPLRVQLSESRTHLERHEKLASLGVFAAGIAHEIRNPLTAIKVRLFSLKRSVPDESSVQDDVQVISDEINRLERIVGDFLQFARPPELQCRLVNLGELVQEAGHLLEPQLAKRAVRLIHEAAPGVWVLADPEKMKQVLINLIQNAGQSIEGNGTVTLRVTAAQRTLVDRLAPVAVVEISDTGMGMPPEVVKRLFDPFFTTKEDGTGLGLPIAARIIELHGGVIEYDTQPQHGTTFRILLPRTTNHEEPTPNSAH